MARFTRFGQQSSCTLATIVFVGFIAACSGTTQGTPAPVDRVKGAVSIDREGELPQCNPSRTGAVYYVVETDELVYCSGRSYVALQFEGEAGADGLSYVVALAAASEEACPAGGIEISVGPDADGDGIIDLETTSASVCNGQRGPAGPQGEMGEQGEPAVPCTTSVDANFVITLSCPGSAPVRVNDVDGDNVIDSLDPCPLDPSTDECSQDPNCSDTLCGQADAFCAEDLMPASGVVCVLPFDVSTPGGEITVCGEPQCADGVLGCPVEYESSQRSASSSVTDGVRQTILAAQYEAVLNGSAAYDASGLGVTCPFTLEATAQVGATLATSELVCGPSPMDLQSTSSEVLSYVASAAGVCEFFASVHNLVADAYLDIFLQQLDQAVQVALPEQAQCEPCTQCSNLACRAVNGPDD